MPDVIPILRRRRDRRAQRRRSAQSRTQRFSLGLGFVVSILLSLSFLGVALYYASLTRDLPSIEILPRLLNPPDGILLQPTRVYDRSGEHILKTFAPSDSPRRYIPLDPQNPQHLPDSLARAVIAESDPQFWQHSGYAIAGLDQPDVHPTIAQKLTFDLLLWNEPPSLRRALRERLLAAQLTTQYGRTQVLEWYLNSANFGNYAYGADAAAQLYFGKPATDLTLAESATLSATSAAPSLNPLDAPQAAMQRGRELIHVMEALGLVSDEDAAQALAESPSYSGKGAENTGNFAPAFLHLVLSQLEGQFDRERLLRGGLTITTSLDYDLQEQSTCVLRVYLQRLQAQPEDTTNCQAARLLPSLPPGISIPGAAASVLILDPKTGQVLAVVGETSAGQETASLTAHNAGSLLTPFIYLTGFARGMGPASLVWDVPGIAPVNNTNGDYHGPVRLRLALANDYLVPAAHVMDQVGLENVTRTLESFGIAPELATVPLSDPISLTLLDASSAYGVFATQGAKYGQSSAEGLTPVSVLRVESVDHAVWLDWNNPQAQPVVMPQLAYLMNNILSDETARWPSLGRPNATEIGRPAGVKLGTTLDGKDAWALGYTPYRVAAVWTGTRDENTKLSPRFSAVLWHAVMQVASSNLPFDGWNEPPGITEIDVCDPSGLLPTKDCPTIVREVFANGSEPTQLDNLYRVYEINRETGFLATVFTPPQLVEQRVYMEVPPEARAWADAHGLKTPPDSYDAIQPVTINPNVNITSPEMFADVRGAIDITGTAAGDDLDYYRVLVGRGLNPQDWVQVGEDSKTAVEVGTLASWNTSGLNGLYAIQLQAVRADQRVDIAVAQVTVDNTAPTVSISYPVEGQEFEYGADRQLTIQVQASDNLDLAVVEFFVDGNSAGSLENSPFALTWNLRRGEHRLRVVARDRAGNESESTVQFVVK